MYLESLIVYIIIIKNARPRSLKDFLETKVTTQVESKRNHVAVLPPADCDVGRERERKW